MWPSLYVVQFEGLLGPLEGLLNAHAVAPSCAVSRLALGGVWRGVSGRLFPVAVRNRLCTIFKTGDIDVSLHWI